jgi:Protein of unknown function (DUF2726)
MDVVSMWPLALAGVSTAGLAAAWWWVRARAATESAPPSRARPRSKPRAKPLSDDQLDTLMDWQPMATRVLTSTERDACHVLRKALPEHMVLAQVPVARFIKVPTRNAYSEWLRRVGSLCADLVVCDMNSQVIAVVEVRQPLSRENERAQRRHARMDRVLRGAQIPVHIWLEGALPGPAVAREAILGTATAANARMGRAELVNARRDAEAAAVVASMQSAGGLRGLSVNERTVDVVLDDALDDWEDTGSDAEHKEPPPSTWFDDLDSGRMPLEASARMERV